MVVINIIQRKLQHCTYHDGLRYMTHNNKLGINPLVSLVKHIGNNAIRTCPTRREHNGSNNGKIHSFHYLIRTFVMYDVI